MKPASRTYEERKDAVLAVMTTAQYEAALQVKVDKEASGKSWKGYAAEFGVNPVLLKFTMLVTLYSNPPPSALSAARPSIYVEDFWGILGRRI